jgi:hypothetical protein
LENWRLLQELAGVLDQPAAGAAPRRHGDTEKKEDLGGAPAKPVAKVAKAVAAEGATKPTAGNGQAAKANGHAAEGLAVGSRIRLRDKSGWMPGVVSSLDPVVLSLEDESVIRTTFDVLVAGLAEGLIERQ